MTWTNPKTDWTTNDVISYADLNRIEENTVRTQEVFGDHIQGFELDCSDITDANAGEFDISGGSISFYGASGASTGVRVGSTYKKTNGAFVAGTTNGAKAPGSNAFADGDWWYIFLVYNSVNDDFDYMMDDNPAGTNVTGFSYDKNRLVATIQVYEVTPAVFGFHPMYSRDDVTYLGGVNDLRLLTINRAQSVLHETIALQTATGYMVPALEVEIDGLWIVGITGAAQSTNFLPSKFANIAALAAFASDQPAGWLYSTDPDRFYAKLPMGSARTFECLSNPTGGYGWTLNFYIHSFKFDRNRQGDRT